MTVLLTFPVTGVEYNNEKSEFQNMVEYRHCQMADLWNYKQWRYECHDLIL